MPEWIRFCHIHPNVGIEDIYGRYQECGECIFEYDMESQPNYGLCMQCSYADETDCDWYKMPLRLVQRKYKCKHFKKSEFNPNDYYYGDD